jgi:crotonobetainyl-CoA:carnitine CoA-transferase CaiB-like acyl-CoA transferase
MWHRFGMMDHLAAMASVVATLLALVGREHTRQGQDVAASLLGAAVLTSGHTYRRADGTVAPVPTLDGAQLGVHVACRLYRAEDGWVAVVDPRPGAARRLAAATGADGLSGLERAFASMTVAEALAALASHGVPAEAARLAQRDPFFDSEANSRCRLTVSYEHPVYGRLEQVGAFWDFGDLPLRLERPAPTLGQHTEEVLAELTPSGHRPVPSPARRYLAG